MQIIDRFSQYYTVYAERAGTLADRFYTARETRASNFGNPDGRELGFNGAQLRFTHENFAQVLQICY